MSAPAAPSVRVAPRRHSRLRLATFRAAETAARALGGRAWYRRRHLARARLHVREEHVAVVGLERALDGLTIAHVSDLHGGPFLARGDLADVVDVVNARAPDLVALTGDWITHVWSDALPLVDDLARLVAPLGVYSVFGNHDYRGRLEGRIADAGARAGIRFLRNEGVVLERGGARFALVGLEDPEEAREVDLARARADVDPALPEVVLCHNPLAARRIARPGCAAILAGHSHGTQVDLPWLRRLGPAHPGLRVELGSTVLVVSRGLGVVGLPWRVGAPAELVFVRLVRAEGSA